MQQVTLRRMPVRGSLVVLGHGHADVLGGASHHLAHVEDQEVPL